MTTIPPNIGRKHLKNPHGRTSSRTARPSTSSEWEDLLARELRKATGLAWRREYKFCRHRDWRFDMAWVRGKVAVEIEGRHHCKVGQHRKDCEKFNTAAMDGWTVLRFPASSVQADCRRPDIVEQVHRVVTGVRSDSHFVRILTGRKR